MMTVKLCRHTNYHPKISHVLLILLCIVTVMYVLTYSSTALPSPGKETEAMAAVGLKVDGRNFTLNRKPLQILSGSLHYFRVPRMYWEDRILKLKAMGLNTIDTYVPWNAHEPEPGVFDFEEDLNLKSFLHLADVYGMYVILRPGPYICTEWDLGGLPSWLLRDPDMKLRTMYKPFLDASDKYLDKVLAIAKPYQFTFGGPIIAFQIENEYGTYGTSNEYMQYMKDGFEKRGVKELMFVCDNEDGIGKYKLEGVLQTINYMSRNADRIIEKLEKLQPNGPLFVTELWVGWFTHWRKKSNIVKVKDVKKAVTKILERGGSFNLYMAHGGTNFGFMNGANADDDGSNYEADVTSYDYDAPVTETGGVDEKYDMLKQLIVEYSKPKNLPWISTENTKTGYGDVEFAHYMTLDDLMKAQPHEKLTSEYPMPMEMLPINNKAGQSYGYIVYEKVVPHSVEFLKVKKVGDYARVLMNGRLIHTNPEGYHDIKLNLKSHLKADTKNLLQIIVENCGRVNYGRSLDIQRKGIVGHALFDEKRVKDWSIYPLQFKQDFVENITSSSNWKVTKKDPDVSVRDKPVLYKGTMFVHAAPRDTYLNMRGWGKGVVFVNGRNLGRYWDVGPQHFLYLPASWLRRNENSIIVFDLNTSPIKTKSEENQLPAIVSDSFSDYDRSKAKPFLI